MRSLLFLSLGLLVSSPPTLAAPVAPPTLCRVTASYRPVAWPFWASPAERFRQITVRLDPACPPTGLAHIRFFNSASGRSLPERGTLTLTAARTIYRLPNVSPGSGVMATWKVLWEAQSGKPYVVPQSPHGAP